MKFQMCKLSFENAYCSFEIWTLWFDVVPNSTREDTINRRLQQGFRRITQPEAVPVTEPDNPNKVVIRRNWRNKRQTQEEKKERTDLDLVNGSQFDLEISGEIYLDRRLG